MKNIFASVKGSNFPTLKRFLAKPYGVSLAAIGGIMVLSCIMPLFFGLLNDGFTEFTYAFVALATVLSYGLVLLVPAISLTARQGWKAGILVVVYEVIWMVIILLSIALLFPWSEMSY